MAELSSDNVTVSKLEATILEQRKTIDKLREQEKGDFMSIADLEEEKDTLSTQIKRLEEKLRDRESKDETAKKNYAHLYEQNKALLTECKDVKARADNAQKTIKSRDGTIAGLKDDLTRLVQDNERRVFERGALQTRIDNGELDLMVSGDELLIRDREIESLRPKARRLLELQQLLDDTLGEGLKPPVTDETPLFEIAHMLTNGLANQLQRSRSESPENFRSQSPEMIHRPLRRPQKGRALSEQMPDSDSASESDVSEIADSGDEAGDDTLLAGELFGTTRPAVSGSPAEAVTLSISSVKSIESEPQDLDNIPATSQLSQGPGLLGPIVIETIAANAPTPATATFQTIILASKLNTAQLLRQLPSWFWALLVLLCAAAWRAYFGEQHKWLEANEPARYTLVQRRGERLPTFEMGGDSGWLRSAVISAERLIGVQKGILG